VDARGSAADHFIACHVFASLSDGLIVAYVVETRSDVFDAASSGAPVDVAASSAAVSWSSILAGAFVAAGISLIHEHR
jgi:hypothetical protein